MKTAIMTASLVNIFFLVAASVVVVTVIIIVVVGLGSNPGVDIFCFVLEASRLMESLLVQVACIKLETFSFRSSNRDN